MFSFSFCATTTGLTLGFFFQCMLGWDGVAQHCLGFFLFRFRTLTSILAGIASPHAAADRPTSHHTGIFFGSPDQIRSILRFLRSFFCDYTGTETTKPGIMNALRRFFFLLWLLGNRQTGRRPGFWTDRWAWLEHGGISGQVEVAGWMDGWMGGSG